MAKTDTAATDLRKGAKVVARVAMRDVPEGTNGKVTMVTGLTWIRYWVRFENGVALGSIDRSKLATADQWKRHLAGEDVFAETSADADADAGDEVAAEADNAGGLTTPSGTFVSQKHIDRAKAARARLTGG